MKPLKRFLCLLATMLAICPAHCQAMTNYSAAMLNAQEAEMINFVREDRAKYGLSLPTIDAQLCEIARIKANDMLNSGYFSHNSPTYGDIRSMLTHFGVDFNGASENIARSRTVEHAEAVFLSSSSHRITLMGRQWTRMGVGVATTPEGFVYVVQIFVR